jgi:hypothetical protein
MIQFSGWLNRFYLSNSSYAGEDTRTKAENIIEATSLSAQLHDGTHTLKPTPFLSFSSKNQW